MAMRAIQHSTYLYPSSAAGPSGAGKSTLLNVLACRMDKGATLEGKVRLNGQTYELAHLKRIVSSSAPAPPSVTV